MEDERIYRKAKARGMFLYIYLNKDLIYIFIMMPKLCQIDFVCKNSPISLIEDSGMSGFPLVLNLYLIKTNYSSRF